MKDWRGNEIEVGTRVIWHGESSYRVGIGTVTKLESYTSPQGYTRVVAAWVDWHEHKAHSNTKSQPLDPDRLTALTKDMLSE